MPWFAVEACGENYMLKTDAEPARLMGFYVEHYVEAQNPEAAKAIVLETIRTNQQLNEMIVDDDVSKPITKVEDVYEFEPETDPNDETVEWRLFPMNEEE